MFINALANRQCIMVCYCVSGLCINWAAAAVLCAQLGMMATTSLHRRWVDADIVLNFALSDDNWVVAGGQKQQYTPAMHV
jgi:hypothetical protein